jgi:hypothetical protein
VLLKELRMGRKNVDDMGAYRNWKEATEETKIES